ncbi:MAG TPA: MFS transporter [Longimicrobiaceae bacterium]|jgi:fucose permease|nr:MFS transporter [Longimicrobiaceae bacterium]
MYNRRLVFTAACLGMLIFGVVLTTLGAILPSLIERFGLDKASAGSLFLLMSSGILAGSLLFGPAVDRYGYKGLLLASLLLVLLGLEGIAFAGSLGVLRLAIFAVGLGGGVINGGTNALVSDVSEEGRSAGLSLLGIFFGVGAVGVPFSLGVLLDVFSYGALVAAAGLTVLVPLALTAAIGFPTPKQAQGLPPGSAARLLGDRALILFGLLLFLQSGMEITVGGWAATYFQEHLALTGNRALFFLSLFWFGMMLARLVLGGVLRRAAPAAALRGAIGIACVGALLLLASTQLALAALGIFLIGAGLAAGFPVVLGFVGDRYAALSGTAFSIVLTMGLIGGSLLPWTTGVLGQAYGLRSSLLLVPVALALQLVLLAIVLRQRGALPAAAPAGVAGVEINP